MKACVTGVAVLAGFLHLSAVASAQTHSHPAEKPREMNHEKKQMMPSDLDTNRVQRSRSGRYVLAYEVHGGKVATNTLHDWKFSLKTTEGEPVAGAQITIQGEMPSHTHGMRTTPKVTMAYGKMGIYVVEGMVFQMPGWWKVVCSVQVGTVKDEIVFNVLVD